MSASKLEEQSWSLKPCVDVDEDKMHENIISVYFNLFISEMKASQVLVHMPELNDFSLIKEIKGGFEKSIRTGPRYSSHP